MVPFCAAAAQQKHGSGTVCGPFVLVTQGAKFIPSRLAHLAESDVAITATPNARARVQCFGRTSIEICQLMAKVRRSCRALVRKRQTGFAPRK